MGKTPYSDGVGHVRGITTNSVNRGTVPGSAAAGYGDYSTAKPGAESKRVSPATANAGSKGGGPLPMPRPKTGSSPATVNKSDQRFEQRSGLKSKGRVL
jgi:hypothetical protein